MPKSSKKKASTTKHQPLGSVIQSAADSLKYARPSRRAAKPDEGDVDDDEAEFLSEKDSAKVYNMARQQREEVEDGGQEPFFEDGGLDGEEKKKGKKKYEDDGSSSEYDSEDSEEEEVEEVEVDESDFLRATRGDDGYVDVSVGLSKEEEERITRLMGGSGGGERRTLADMIMEKIGEKERGMEEEGGGDEEEVMEEQESPFDPKVVAVYTDIGKVLSRYTAGKLPKAFKVIPSLTEWEEILYLTRPDKWTPQAMFAATKIFAR